MDISQHLRGRVVLQLTGIPRVQNLTTPLQNFQVCLVVMIRAVQEAGEYFIPSESSEKVTWCYKIFRAVKSSKSDMSRLQALERQNGMYPTGFLSVLCFEKLFN